MPLTRDANYPVEAASLAQAMASLAVGHSVDTVVNAAIQVAAMTIGGISRDRGLSLDATMGLLAVFVRTMEAQVRTNYDRRPQPTDVKVQTS